MLIFHTKKYPHDLFVLWLYCQTIPDSKVHGANMGPIWGRQDPGGPHVDPVDFAIWDSAFICILWCCFSGTGESYCPDACQGTVEYIIGKIGQDQTVKLNKV